MAQSVTYPKWKIVEKQKMFRYEFTTDDTRAAFKIVEASLEARSQISSSIERTARLAVKCQIKNFYISVNVNFLSKESQMKRKCTNF